jgi:dsDNA-specific endonuclease/ATPase MutS2
MGFVNWLRNILGNAHAEEQPDSSFPSETADDVDVDPFNPFPEPVEIEITDVIDLHTISPREVKRVVEEYLIEAHRAGFRSIRIIHGKGIGAQRELVSRILSRTPFVEDWTNAPPEAGGWGATIVQLSQS